MILKRMGTRVGLLMRENEQDSRRMARSSGLSLQKSPVLSARL
jgi:hypothetical protein